MNGVPHETDAEQERIMDQRQEQRERQSEQVIHDNFDILDDRAKLQFIKDRYEVLARLFESYFYSLDPGLDHRRPAAYFFKERATMRSLLENIRELTQDQITNLINRTQTFRAIFGNNFDNFQVFARFSHIFREMNDDLSFALIDYLLANQNNRQNINPIINNLAQDMSMPIDIRPIQPWVFNHLILNNDLPEMLEFIELRNQYNPYDDPTNTARPEPGVDDVDEDDDYESDRQNDWGSDWESEDEEPPRGNAPARNQQRQSRRVRGINPAFSGVESGRGRNPITLGKRPMSARGPEVHGEYISFDEAKAILDYIINSRQQRGNYRSIDGKPLTNDKVDEIIEFVNNVQGTHGGRKTRKNKKIKRVITKSNNVTTKSKKVITKSKKGRKPKSIRKTKSRKTRV